MIHIIHTSCGQGLRVSPGEEGEAEHLFGKGAYGYPDGFRCFVCGAKAAEILSVVDAETMQSLDFYDVSPQEAVAAMNGLGLPFEQDCGAAAVERLFLEKKVRRVVTRPIRGSHRCTVQSFEFEDGTKAYLGASSHGATVYRVSPKNDYLSRVHASDHASIQP